MIEIFYEGELVPWRRVYLNSKGKKASAKVPESDLFIGSMNRLYPFRGELPPFTLLLYMGTEKPKQIKD